MSTTDNVLEEWDRRYNAQERKAKLDREQIPAGKGRRGGSAVSARAALKGVARKAPQAVFKITGGGKSASAIGAHLRYISRNGELDLEDQDGHKHTGKEGRHDIIERWEDLGLPKESNYKEAYNIVLSSPKGVDSASVLKAARDFAAEQFGGRFDYAMALHCPESDPSAKKSENAHVHLVVRARGYDGRKLNPRKADLFAYRQAYARHLRAHGIDVIAVRREAVFNTKNKGLNQPVYQMKKRGALGPQQRQAEAARKALDAEHRALELYTDLVANLARSQLPGDRSLAESLRQVLPSQPAQGPKRRSPGR